MPTDTFSITAGANDSNILSNQVSPYSSLAYSSHSSNGTLVAATRSKFTNFQNYLAALRFNTSSLPDDATIESAILRLRVFAKANADSRSLVGDYFAWTGSGSGDWTLTAPASPILSATIASISTGATVDIPLTDLSGISKTGNTSIRLHISGGAPTGENSVSIYALEDASQPEPQLLVTYSTGADLVGMVGI